MPTAPEDFIILRRMLEEPLLGFLWRHALGIPSRSDRKDSQVPGSSSIYGDVVMEHLLLRLQPEVEAALGISLHPTYSYCRLYGHGDALARHTDRPACEISMTVNLGQDPPVPWPLWIEGREGVQAVRLEPGDGLIYRGIEAAHWRDEYPGSRLAQVFLHYVDKDGPHAQWRYDKRPALNLPISLPI